MQSRAETEVAGGERRKGRRRTLEQLWDFFSLPFFFRLRGGEEEKKMKEEKNCKAWRVPPTPSSHTLHARTHTQIVGFPPTPSSRGHPSSKKNYKGGG